MATGLDNPTHPEPRSLSIRLPRPLWVGVATVALVVVAFGLGIGVPHHRKQTAIREVSAAAGRIGFRRDVPEILRDLLGEKRMQWFDSVESVSFDPDPEILRLRYKGAWNGPVSWSSRATKVDHSTLRHIAQFTSLKTLRLSFTNVGGSGIEAICGLAQLEDLDIDGTAVSDAQVSALSRLQHLKFLSVKDSLVTRSGYLQLRQSLPGCRVIGGASAGYGDSENPDYCFSAEELFSSNEESRQPE